MTREPQIRLWPGVVIVIGQWMLWLGASRAAPAFRLALAGGDEMSEQR